MHVDEGAAALTGQDRGEGLGHPERTEDVRREHALHVDDVGVGELVGAR